MNQLKRIATFILLCVSAFTMPAEALRPQDESGKKNADGKKMGRKPPLTTVHIKVSADGVNPLPDQSSIQLKGLDDCDMLTRRGDLDADGEITFSELPVCKVMLKILITGFETKSLSSVDLADPKNLTMRIHVKAAGPPQLN